MDLPSQDKPLDFTTLSEIMQHFHNVPYDQFQIELNDWFIRKMSEGQVGLTVEEKQSLPDLSQLPRLISKIYHHAEVMTVISDYKIHLTKY